MSQLTVCLILLSGLRRQAFISHPPESGGYPTFVFIRVSGFFKPNRILHVCNWSSEKLLMETLLFWRRGSPDSSHPV